MCSTIYDGVWNVLGRALFETSVNFIITDAFVMLRSCQKNAQAPVVVVVEKEVVVVVAILLVFYNKYVIITTFPKAICLPSKINSYFNGRYINSKKRSSVKKLNTKSKVHIVLC
jgi:hypothetical protein